MIRIVGALVLALAAGPLGAASVDELDWLAGCWVAEGGEPGTVEQWTAPAGGTVLGVSRTVRDGATVAWEHLRIEERADGEVVLVALPSGQSEAEFRRVRSGEREVVFENPDHDFPQRIAYRLDQEGRLVGRIEGALDGAERVLEVPMRRIPCDGG